MRQLLNLAPLKAVVNGSFINQDYLDLIIKELDAGRSLRNRLFSKANRSNSSNIPTWIIKELVREYDSNTNINMKKPTNS